AQVKDQNPLPEEITLQNEEIQAVYRCLDTCTVDQRMVIMMRYIHDLSISETADVLGWSESKVKTTQHRAMKQLKSKMNELMAKEGLQSEEIRVER
ncbi:sigma-70 family RNA polymerase sigma factor, partial [Bacillaceae bacterium Marseille-Q3522]|nr:sigma-70 family RNA polymerase sigma factor [Bacillaceae bacterium Marseille-Q3522]